TSIVLGSAANGLPPGVGLHAELRALAGAGLDAEHVLRTAGINAAAALGLGLQLGRIAPGAVGDIVLVDGDPLANIEDALKVVGIVRNGRFFSTIGLLERVPEAQSVE
ncbi:MAG: amidohydrolase family protein, partial [Woeseiaceae bacterium]|nr:amidohydrolase family protein [Woeseiaceae bacterium]